MARGKGFQNIAGWRHGSTWGTAVAAGAGHGIELTAPPNIQGNTVAIEDRSITGIPTQRGPIAGNRIASVSFGGQLKYEGVGRVIAQVFGTAGVPTTVDTSARQHVYKIKAHRDGIFSTLAHEIVKDTTIYEAPSVKLSTLTLRSNSGGLAEWEVSGPASDLETASAVNTTTTIDTITLPANREFVPFRQMVVRINAQSGGALGSSDVRYVTGFEFTLERNVSGDVTTEFGNKISEPSETDFARVTGSVTFAELQNGTGGSLADVATQLAFTAQKMDVTFTSTNLAGAASQMFSHKLWFPYISFGEGKPAPAGPGKIGWTLPFTAHHVTTAPTGFTAGYTDSVVYEEFNQATADSLA